MDSGTVMEEKPKSRRGRKVNFEPRSLESRFPRLSDLLGPATTQNRESWDAEFREQPHAMYSILSDIIKVAHARPGRVGQRPMPKEEEVDLDTLLYGEVSNEPLIVALPKVMEGMSERKLAEKVKMSRTQLQRLLKGEYEPDVYLLREIAKAVNVPPAFFLEYRVAMVMMAMHSMMADNPNVATIIYKKYLTVKGGR